MLPAADETRLFVSLAQYGKDGGGLAGWGTGNQPASHAVLYDPAAAAGQRYTCLGLSSIPRLFLSSALLLPSADVLVGGSEQGKGTWC